MAVTLTLEQLADHLRIERAAVAVGTPVNTVLAEMLALATATVEQYAVSAPDSAHNIAAARMVGYAFDAPPAAAMTAYAAIMLNSGAAHFLNPWRSARAGPEGATASGGFQTAAGGLLLLEDAP